MGALRVRVAQGSSDPVCFLSRAANPLGCRQVTFRAI